MGLGGIGCRGSHVKEDCVENGILLGDRTRITEPNQNIRFRKMREQRRATGKYRRLRILQIQTRLNQ